ncbi:MAG TPA: xanthine dehydrogenase family protein subunit M [Nitrolancea sp.]|jgi:carbon-monoxide dehydrogenase medium subunit|nr:xanthine dehydrogenase family protein subunit M [Nitrolancea sp.]
MYPSEFDYFAPTSVDEVVKLLQENPDGKIIAGGHSLLPMMKLRLAAPASLIDIGKVPGISGIRTENGNVVIGARTTYDQIMKSDDVKNALPVVVEAAGVVGDIQVRNRGTIGGSIAHADPAADFPAVLLTLNASVNATGPNGQRTIGIDDMFVDMFTTSLEPEELVTEISIPQPAANTGIAYEKFSHPASGYAIVGVGASVTLGADGNVSAARVSVTGAGPVAVRATGTEEALVGQAPTADAVKAAAQKASDGMTFLGDIHAGEEYRAHLTRVFTERALNQAIERARG